MVVLVSHFNEYCCTRLQAIQGQRLYCAHVCCVRELGFVINDSQEIAVNGKRVGGRVVRGGKNGSNCECIVDSVL